MHRVNTVCYLLQYVSSQLVKQSDQVLQEQLGIGFSQFKILRSLQASPQVKQRDIAESLGQTEASISRQVKLMADQGLLKMVISPDSHRVHLAIVTLKGERLTEAAIEVLNKYHTPAFEAFNEKQCDQLVDMLKKLYEFYGSATESAGGKIN